MWVVDLHGRIYEGVDFPQRVSGVAEFSLMGETVMKRLSFVLFTLGAATLVVPACKSTFSVCSDCGEGEGEREGDGDGDESLGGQGGSSDGMGGALSCGEDQVVCEGACIDPLTDRQHCGAADDCLGVNAGGPCEEGDRCEGGVCVLDCLPGMIDCEGKCVDPLSNELYCGAEGACDSQETYGDYCDGAEVCSGGVCRSWGEGVQFGATGNAYAWASAMGPNGHAMAMWHGPGASYYRPSMGWESTSPPADLAAGYPSSLEITPDGDAVSLRRGPFDAVNHIRTKYWSASESTWMDAVDLEADTVNAYASQPLIAMSDDGRGTGAWLRSFSGDASPEPRIMVATLPAGSSDWHGPEELVVGATTPLALARRGPVSVVAYQAADSETLLVQAKEDEIEWGEAAPISGGEAAPTDVEIGIDDKGNIVAVWKEGENTSEALWSATYDAAAEDWRPPVSLTTDDVNFQEFRFALTGSGHGLLLWVSEDQQGEGALGCASFRALSGWAFDCAAPQGEETSVSLPRLATRDNSSIHAAWLENDVIRSSIYDVLGEGWNAPGTVAVPNAEGAESVWYLQIHRDQYGRSFAFWGYWVSSVGYFFGAPFD